MDQFDYSDDALQPTRDSAAIIWNILTLVVVLLTLCVCVGVTAILVNPQVSFNPFPPPTLPVEVELPTVTPTPRSVLPATWTPTVTILPTNTPTSTITLVPSATQPPATMTQAVGPSVTPGEGEPTATQGENTATPSPTEGMPFVLHPGDPVAIQNIGNPELGCDWMGVAGQAFDLTLAPIEEGLFVQLGGILGDELVEMLGMVGNVDTYGPGSYEFELGDEPIESSQTLWVQLFDQAMLPLSEQISFDTFADCERNLILIHFNQVR